jgi:hypothetical protein
MNYLPMLALKCNDPPDFSLPNTRITRMNHWCPTCIHDLIYLHIHIKKKRESKGKNMMVIVDLSEGASRRQERKRE